MLPASAFRSSGENQFIDKKYQRLMTLLLSLTFGEVFFDRSGVGFLKHFISADLHLNLTDVVLQSSGWSVN